MKILHKLSLSFLIVSLLVFAVGIFSAYKSQKLLKKNIVNFSSVVVKDLMEKVDATIYQRIQQLKVYSFSLEKEDLLLSSNRDFDLMEDTMKYIKRHDHQWISKPQEEITHFMQSIMENELSLNMKHDFELKSFYDNYLGYPVYLETFLTNKYGANVAQTEKTSDYYQGDEKWWQQAREEGLYVSDVEYDQSVGRYSISIAIRVEGEPGNFMGVVKTVVNMDEIFLSITKLKEQLNENTGGHFKVLTKKGKVIYSSEEFNMFDDFPLFEEKVKNPTSTNNYFIKKGGYHGEAVLVTFAKSRGIHHFKGLGWFVLLEHHTHEIFAPIKNLQNTLFLFAFCLSVVAVFLGFYVAKTISTPIKKLKEVTLKIGKGDFNADVAINTKGEMGDLAVAFSNMAKNLKKITVSRDDLSQEVEERKKAESEIKEANQKLKTATLQVVQAEKLSSLGEMAAGIVHELSQPLNTTKIICQSILKDIAHDRVDTDEIKGELPQVVQQMNRMAGIIDHMRIYTRQTGDDYREKVSINDIITNCFLFLRQQIVTHAIDLEEDYGDDLPLVYVNPIQLEQVFVNLITNARHALETVSEGQKKIAIKTYQGDGGKYVAVSISDNGHGIPEEIQKEIFSPYVTTKEAGKGTGLGLSISNRIILDHNGRIDLESSPGNGSTFRIILPINNSA